MKRKKKKEDIRRKGRLYMTPSVRLYMTPSVTYPIKIVLVEKSSGIHCNGCRHLEKNPVGSQYFNHTIDLPLPISLWYSGFFFACVFFFSFLHNLLRYCIQPLHKTQRTQSVLFCTATRSPRSIKMTVILPVVSCVGGKM